MDNELGRKGYFVSPYQRRAIEDANLFALRDSRTHMLLNVSWSEDGLKFTTNKMGRSLYFVETILKAGSSTFYFHSKNGNLKKSPFVYVEKFVPRNITSSNEGIAARLRREEDLFTDKALKLIAM